MFVAVSSMIVCRTLRFLPAMMPCNFWSISHESAWRPL